MIYAEPVDDLIRKPPKASGARSVMPSRTARAASAPARQEILFAAPSVMSRRRALQLVLAWFAYPLVTRVGASVTFALLA